MSKIVWKDLTEAKQEQLISDHAKWLMGYTGGNRLDLENADLRDADLQGANLVKV